MERSPSIDQFLTNPVGHWVVVSPTGMAYCVEPTLAGCAVWGRPSCDDTAAMLRAFGGRFHPDFGHRFDLVVDGTGIEGVDPDALELLIRWLLDNRDHFLERVRLQVGIVSRGLVGVTLSGILPVLGTHHALRIFHDKREAFGTVSMQAGAIAEEVEAAIAEARGGRREIRELRDLLRARPSGTNLEAAARLLAVSARSLQRVLNEAGTTFSQELRDARFDVAETRLVNSDEKIASVAVRVGLSENALAQLVRDKRGMTPAELRKRER